MRPTPARWAFTGLTGFSSQEALFPQQIPTAPVRRLSALVGFPPLRDARPLERVWAGALSLKRVWAGALYALQDSGGALAARLRVSEREP
jgi:hypothetical protein